MVISDSSSGMFFLPNLILSLTNDGTNIENLFKFDITPHFPVTVDELSFLFKLLNVDIARPNKSCENPYSCAECGNKSVHLLLVCHSQETEEDVHHY